MLGIDFILIIVFFYFYGLVKCMSIGIYDFISNDYFIVYIRYDLFIFSGSLGVSLFFFNLDGDYVFI